MEHFKHDFYIWIPITILLFENISWKADVQKISSQLPKVNGDFHRFGTLFQPPSFKEMSFPGETLILHSTLRSQPKTNDGMENGSFVDSVFFQPF